MQNPDYMMYVNLYNILTLRGQRDPGMFYPLLFPFEAPGHASSRPRSCFEKIKIPFVTGAFEGAYTYKMHWQGAQHYFAGHRRAAQAAAASPRRLTPSAPSTSGTTRSSAGTTTGSKGSTTASMDDPAVRVWVHGREQVARRATDWPAARDRVDQLLPAQLGEAATRKGHLPATRRPTSTSRRTPSCRCRPPQTNKIERLRYMTEPLAEDTLVVGPHLAHLLGLARRGRHQLDRHPQGRRPRRVGADGPAGRARSAHRPARAGTHARLAQGLTPRARSGALQALEALALPQPRDDPAGAYPGRSNEYQVEILSTANLFKAGHRICLEITSLDLSEGVAGETYAEYIPNHVCSQQDRAAQGVPQRGVSVAPAAARNPPRLEARGEQCSRAS